MACFEQIIRKITADKAGRACNECPHCYPCLLEFIGLCLNLNPALLLAPSASLCHHRQLHFLEMNICVLGLWHLGCVTAACLSEHFTIVGADPDPTTVARLQSGEPPVFEPGLADLIRGGL